jgi:F0F1-type ATP synthase membrane subunit c/vacuolar-type H+-ATPase subunit K
LNPIPPVAISCFDALSWKAKFGVFLSLGEAMGRRDFVKGIIGGAVTWPLAARAQQAGKVFRIGFIGPALNSPANIVALVGNLLAISS